MEAIKQHKTDDVHPHIPELQEPPRAGRRTRREFLRMATLLGIPFSSSALLTACVRSTTTNRPSGAAPVEAPFQPRALMGAAVQSATATTVPTETPTPACPQSGFCVVVDEGKCTGCGKCVENCPASVLELIDGIANPVNLRECLRCETCVQVCDVEAITVIEM